MRIDLFHGLRTVFNFAAEKAKQTLAGEFASRGRSVDDYLDVLGVLPDPDPILRKLDQSGSILSDLMADDHLTSVIQTRKVGTLNREWRIEPGAHGGGDPDEQSKKAALAFADDLGNFNMFDVISEILDAPYYGMTPIEIMYEPDGGLWHITNLRCLPSTWFVYDKDNNPRFLSKEEMISGEALPENKFVFARHFPSYENPYGLRLLSRVFWPITFKKGGVRFWMKFLEKFGIPFVIGKYKEGTSKALQAELLNNLVNMVQDAAAVVPEGSAIDVLKAEGKSSSSDGSFSKLKDAMEAGISKVIMGQTLTAELSGDKGSFAASKTHENVLESYRDCDARLVKDTIERIAAIYVKVNFEGASTPRFIWHEEDDPRKEFADRDKVLHDTGVRFKKEYITRVYNIPADEYELADSPNAAPPTDTGEEFAEGEREGDQLLLEDLMDDVIGDGTKAAEGTIKKIMDAVEGSEDYDDLSERLAVLFPELDGKGLSEVLERAIFAAEMFGTHTAVVDDENAAQDD